MENEVLQAIKNRRSVRTYLNIPVPKELLEEIVEVSGYAPSGMNSQQWIFIVVTGKTLEALRITVRDMFRELEFTSEMPPFFLVCKEKAVEDDFSFFYGAPALLIVANREGYKNAMADSAAAMENALIAATSLGLGSCWITTLAGTGEFSGVKEALAALGVPIGYRVFASAAFGYPDAERAAASERTYEIVKWYD